MSHPPRVLPPRSPEVRHVDHSAIDIVPGDNVEQLSDSHNAMLLGSRTQYAETVVRTQSSGDLLSSVGHGNNHSASHCNPPMNIGNNENVGSTVLPVYYSVEGVPAAGVQHVLPSGHSGVMSGQPVAVPVSASVNYEPPSSNPVPMQQMENAVVSGVPVSMTDRESLTTMPSSYSQHIPISVQGLVVVPMYSGTSVTPSNTPMPLPGHPEANNDVLQHSEANYQTPVPGSVPDAPQRMSDVGETGYYHDESLNIDGGKLPSHDTNMRSMQQHHLRMLAPVAPTGSESERPNLSYCTLRQKPMYMALGPCSSEFRTYFHRQQGSKQLHHFISELLSLEEYVPPESCFRDKDISSWSLEYYDPDYTEVLERLVEYSARHRLTTPASGLEQLLCLFVKSRCHEGQFRKATDVAEFSCLVKPNCSDGSTQTDEFVLFEKRQNDSDTPEENLSVDVAGNDAESPEVVTKKNKNKGKPQKRRSKRLKADGDKQTEEKFTNIKATQSTNLDNESLHNAPSKSAKHSSKSPITRNVDDDALDSNLLVEDVQPEDDETDGPRKRKTRNRKDQNKLPKKRKVAQESADTSNNQEPAERSDSSAHESVPKKNSPLVEKCDVGMQIGQNAETSVAYINDDNGLPRKKRVRHQNEQICFLTCMVCGVTFTDMDEYCKHEEEHPSFAQYYCEVCDAMYSSKAHFLQHGMKHYGMMEYKCSHCQWFFPTMKHLKEHFAELVSAVKCPVCEQLLTKFNLNKHIIEHIKGNFSVLQQLHGHQPELLLVAESQLNAIVAGTKSNGKADSDSEEPSKTEKKKGRKGTGGNGMGQDKDRPLRPWMIKDMLGEEVHPTEIYEDLKGDVIPVTKFDGEDVLHQGKTINFYTQKTKIPCVHSECDITQYAQEYTSRALYFPPNTRAVVRSGILKFYNKETFKCTICFKNFSKKIYLNGHYKYVHLNERCHQCQKCFKTFVHATDLGQHMRKHHSDQPNHKCTMCGKVFQDKSSFTKHRQAHDCNKVLCHICNKPFNKRYLREHINYVHKQVKTKCNYCGKSFSTATARRRCEKIHWGTKNYLCADCGKSYFVISDLIQHRKLHHMEEPSPASN